MIERWTVYIAEKYIKTRRIEKRNTTLKLSIAGIAAGVLTLVSVISVMNGLQMGYIEDILEISSYHVRIENIDSDVIDSFETDTEEGGSDAAGKFSIERINSIKGIKKTVPFYDIQSLVQGNNSRLDPVMIRALDPSSSAADKGFLKQLNIVDGDFDITGGKKIVIGNELARILRLKLGDTVSLMVLSGQSFNRLSPDRHNFTVSGIYKSGYYQYDRNLSFISLDSGSDMRAGSSIHLGIKISDIYKDREVISLIKEKQGENLKTVSWRDYNRAFFSALRMEKISMMLLIGLIFVVIGVNIYNSIKRSVAEKMEDISVLYAIGGSEKSVKRIFLIEGFIIGFTGGITGIISGLLVIINLDRIFAAAGFLLQWLIDKIMYLFSVSDIFPSVEISIFPESYFYLSEVPYRILFSELLLIFLFALLSSVGSAYFASRKISVKTPAEYLRYE
jgi:lipoprotein-releasing system permease protein